MANKQAKWRAKTEHKSSLERLNFAGFGKIPGSIRPAGQWIQAQEAIYLIANKGDHGNGAANAGCLFRSRVLNPQGGKGFYQCAEPCSRSLLLGGIVRISVCHSSVAQS
jgi:hypothetical protein